MTVCAIHQPNFFPWLGYFDKIRRADVFVFLDEVAYPRTSSGTWVNRVHLNVQGEARWVGCPLRRHEGGAPIRAVVIDNRQPWRAKMLRTVEMNYKRTANYATAMAMLRPLIEYPEDNLATFNIHAIRSLADALGLEARFVRQSELGVSGTATELLVGIVKEVGADVYLCGGGAGEYQQDDLFPRNGIELVYQNFVPTPYGDPKRFLPGLSVIDFLFRETSPRSPLAGAM